MTEKETSIDDPITGIRDKLSKVSSKPGVYLMKDANGKVIYVGKAGSLKKRLASYFSRSGNSAWQMDLKTQMLIRNVSDVDTIITGSEKEALILESNLIKRYRPRYNVILKDGKRYPSLRLDIKNPYPNLTIVRKTDKNGGMYFGPKQKILIGGQDRVSTIRWHSVLRRAVWMSIKKHMTTSSKRWCYF